jgi:hypothetical protein
MYGSSYERGSSDGGSDELALKRAILAKFRAVARYGTCVGAADFQTALESLGLKFGDRMVDAIMLQCKIDASGQVSPFENQCFRCLPHPAASFRF